MISMSWPDIAVDLTACPHVFPGQFTDLLELGNAYTRNQWQAMAAQVARSDVWVVTDRQDRLSLVGGFYPVEPAIHACWIVTRADLTADRVGVLQAFRALARALPVIAPPGRLFMAVRHGHGPGLGIARVLGFEEVDSVLAGHHTLVRDLLNG